MRLGYYYWVFSRHADEDAGPPAEAPVLDAIDAQVKLSITVNWSAVERAFDYILGR
jgi:hypothetical protein